MARVKDRRAMIAGMSPELREGRYVFASLPAGQPNTELMSASLGTFAEAEGLSLILPEDTARAAGFDVDVVMRQITLSVFSDLEGVGLTAAVSTALADANIPANVVAAFHHDHVFVPADLAEAAMAALRDLQQAAQDEG